MKLGCTARSLAEIPAEPVMGRRTVIQFSSADCRLKCRGGDELVVFQSLVPTVKVLNGRVDVVFAVDEIGRSVVNFDKSPVLLSVASRPVPDNRPCLVVELRVLHAARPKNPLFQERGEPLSRYLLHYKSQQHVA